MIKFESTLQELKNLEGQVSKFGSILNIENSKKELLKLENQTLEEGFWNDFENSKVVLQNIKHLKSKINNYKQLEEGYFDLINLIEMGLEEDDLETLEECQIMYKDFLKSLKKLEETTKFIGEYDKNGAIISLHAGSGGTESCDWVSMLFRMYSKFAEKNDMKLELLDLINGTEAGIKSVSFEVSGINVFGQLKSEKGVHRLVRISPFDSGGRRHTSFASCEVLPIIEDNVDFEINTEDLKIDTYRASGAGGQHVNTTDSAVRITHVPTNTVVQCQNERSQHKNKDRAMKMLKSKLFELREKEKREQLSELKGDSKENAFGSQIRSYVMHPYNMVKDHRTNCETGNVQNVLDGGLNDFISEYLTYINKGEN